MLIFDTTRTLYQFLVRFFWGGGVMKLYREGGSNQSPSLSLSGVVINSAFYLKDFQLKKVVESVHCGNLATLSITFNSAVLRESNWFCHCLLFIDRKGSGEGGSSTDSFSFWRVVVNLAAPL